MVKLFPPFFSENVKKEGDRLEAEVESLKPYKFIGVNGNEITVKYVCLETMLDGKIKCILSDVSNNGRANCWICGCTPTQMSKPKGVYHNFKPSIKGLSLGIAPLHSQLRAFDWVCKHAFHQDFKSWSCVGDVNKAKYAERKQELQDAFDEKLNLKVYMPNPHGGNSNTGKVAKTAFENAEIFSEITNFPLDLIQDLHFMLVALRCGRDIDADSYEILAKDWLKRKTLLCITT